MATRGSCREAQLQCTGSHPLRRRGVTQEYQPVAKDTPNTRIANTKTKNAQSQIPNSKYTPLTLLDDFAIFLYTNQTARSK